MSINPSRIFAVVALGGLAGACSSVPQMNGETCMDRNVTQAGGLFSAGSSKYNERCGQRNAAVTMIQSGNPVDAGVGYRILRKMDANVGDAIDETVRDALNKPQKLNCKVTGVRNIGPGINEVDIGDCIPVNPFPAKKPAEAPVVTQAPSAPKATPGAPKPVAVPVSMQYGFTPGFKFA